LEESEARVATEEFEGDVALLGTVEIGGRDGSVETLPLGIQNLFRPLLFDVGSEFDKVIPSFEEKDPARRKFLHQIMSSQSPVTIKVTWLAERSVLSEDLLHQHSASGIKTLFEEFFPKEGGSEGNSELAKVTNPPGGSLEGFKDPPSSWSLKLEGEI